MGTSDEHTGAHADGSNERNEVQKRKHKVTLSTVISTILMVLAVILAVYPLASNYLEHLAYEAVMDDQSSIVSNISDDGKKKELDKAYKYNDKIAHHIEAKGYDKILNANGDGVMGYIAIPSIDVKLPIYHGTSSEDLMHGVGHLKGTSLPVGGKSTHCVLTGHTGLPSARLFDSIDRLVEGDYFVLSCMGTDIAYSVYSVEVVLPDKTDSLVIEKNKDLCTLVTCTPYGINDHRLLVHAKRIPVPSEYYDNGGADSIGGMGDIIHGMSPQQVITVIIGCTIPFFVLGRWTARLMSRKRRRNEDKQNPRQDELKQQVLNDKENISAMNSDNDIGKMPDENNITNDYSSIIDYTDSSECEKNRKR